MSEVDDSRVFEARQNVLASFDKLKNALSIEKQAKQDRLVAQRELQDFLTAAEGQHFIISAISASRGFRHANGSWTFVPTRAMTEKPVPFEPMELVIGEVGDLFPTHGAVVELYYPGVETSKLSVSLSQIVSIEPVPQTTSV